MKVIIVCINPNTVATFFLLTTMICDSTTTLSRAAPDSSFYSDNKVSDLVEFYLQLLENKMSTFWWFQSIKFILSFVDA